MTDEQALTSFEPMVVATARGICRSKADLEDFEQEGRIAVLRSHVKYKPDSGAAFESFVYGCVRNAMLDYARSDGTHVSLPHEAGVKPVEIEFYGVCASSVDDSSMKSPTSVVDARDWLEKSLARLPDDEAAAIRAVHLDAMSTVEAAKVLGTSKQRVSERVARGMAKMKKWAANE